MRVPTPVSLALIACAVAAPAIAQDAAEDWDVTADPAQQLTLASLDFGGHALALRCKAGVLEFLVTGTPTSTEAFRVVRVTAGGIADERQSWLTQPGLPVLSASEPDRLARQLRAGGDLDLRIEPVATGERGMRFRLSIPPSAAALDRVLSACGAATVDEWDLRPRTPAAGLVWEHQAIPEYPMLAITRDVPLATVSVACVVLNDGRLSECRILSEVPDDLGFGRSAVAAARQSRLALRETDADSVGKIVQYNVRFRGPTN